MSATGADGPEMSPRLQERQDEDSVRRFLSIYDVAAYCSVLPNDVLDWIEAGMLEASCLRSDRYRIVFDDLLVLLHKHPGILERPRYSHP